MFCVGWYNHNTIIIIECYYCFCVSPVNCSVSIIVLIHAQHIYSWGLLWHYIGKSFEGGSF